MSATLVLHLGRTGGSAAARRFRCPSAWVTVSRRHHAGGPALHGDLGRGGSTQSLQPSDAHGRRMVQVRASASPPSAENGSPPTKKKKLPPAPTCIVPPDLPDDITSWQNAMVLIDKPKDWTSFDLCGKLRSALKIKKVGHAGTLDPMATGLVIVCVGKGTKHVDSFMAQDKEYTGTIRLGEATASYDAESEVTESLPWEHITDQELWTARDAFLGDIQQVPPMYSAIKIKGKKLYELARKGKEVERPPRDVSVAVFDLERDALDRQLLHFRVVCSKGTYIRSLAHDLGKSVGTVAHLTALRRTRIGAFDVQNAWEIVELADLCWEKRKAKKNAEEAQQHA